MANPTSFVIKTIVRTIIQTGPRPTGASVATTTYSAEPAKTPISNLPVSAQHDVPIVTSSSRLYLVTNALPFPESASAPSVPSITVPATGVASGEGVYNRTTLIVCMIILGVIALAIGSWLMRCLVARRCPRRNLESLVHEEKGPEEAARRVSTLVLLEDTPSRRRSFVSDIGSVELAESVIGVASTTSLPASSSKTAIATDAYPRPVEARLRVRISPQEPSTAMIISASEVGEGQYGNHQVDRPLVWRTASIDGSEKTSSHIPYSPVPAVDRAYLTADFVPLSHLGPERYLTFRSPIDSVYAYCT